MSHKIIEKRCIWFQLLDHGWPVVLSGRDLVGVAETGSGKTLGYAIPAIIHINGQRLLERGEGPIVLVMVPTRELAVQIQSECQKFASVCQISTAAVYGGSDRAMQHQLLQRGSYFFYFRKLTL